MRQTAGRKEKIGTILDEEVVRIIKERAHKERRSISDIIQESVLKCNDGATADAANRRRAVKRFCSKPFDLKINALKELLSEDYYQA